MNDLDIEIQIDCSPQYQSRRIKPTKTKEPSIPTRRAPVALNQRPVPPPDEWDQAGAQAIEFGSVEELRKQLITLLEEALARAKGDWQPQSWEFTSKSWPFTRIGSLMLRSISLAATIGEKTKKT